MAPARPEVLTVGNDHWRLGVLPGTGASLAFGQVRLGDRWVDLLRPTRPEGLRRYPWCASYVLVPFSNRVRDGLLRDGGRSWQLRPNSLDGTAIHGAAHEWPWQVADKSAESVTLTFDATAVVGVNFPWAFRAEVTYAVVGPRAVVRTVLTNVDGEAFPAGFGHHPFFRRGLLDPEVSEIELELPFGSAYPLERGMATGPAGPLPPAVDHRSLRPLGEVPLDDCLTGRRGADPVRMVWPRSGVEVQMHADEVFSHLVVYAPRGKPFVAVEPVTNANDAVTLRADGVAGHGLVDLVPGESRSGEVSLALVLG